MRAPGELVHSRARIRQRYAMFPLEGYPTSKLPHSPTVEARILTAPAMGAAFVEYLLDAPSGTIWRYDHAPTQEFGYVLSGRLGVSMEGESHQLSREEYFYIPEMQQYELKVIEPARVLFLRKRYESAGVHNSVNPGAIFGDASIAPSEPFMGNEHARLQMLLPDTIPYDFAMNIFTFDP